MLNFQLVQAPFRFGVDEGTDPKQVPFGTLMTAQNVVWEKSGRLQKRNGTTALTRSIVGGGTISTGERLIVRGTELALTDGSSIYSYTSDGWVNRGRHPEIGLTWRQVQDSIGGAKTYDVAYLSNGQEVHAWATGDATSITGEGDVYYQILDSETGAVVVSPTLLESAGGYRIRVIARGTSWVILWTSAAGALKCRTSSGTTTLKTDACTDIKNMSLDACVIGTEWVVAYALLAGGIRLVRYSFAGTPVQQATATVTGETALEIEALSIAGASGETLYIAYFTHDARKFFFAAANPSTLAQTVAPTVVDNQSGQNPANAIVGVERETSTTCIVLWSFSTTSNKDQSSGVTHSASITNAGAITKGQTAYFVRLLSRPFYINNRPYAVLGNWTLADTFTAGNNDGIAGSDLFLVDATVAGGASEWLPFRQVGKIEWTIGGVWAPGFVSNATIKDSMLSFTPAPYLSNALSNFESWRQGVKLLSVTVGDSLPKDMWRSASFGQEACFAAGVLTSYDGIEAIGYGFAHGPQLDPSNTLDVTGGSMAAGDYIYDVTAERRSASGMLYRSPIGTPTTVAVGASGKVSIAIVPVSISFSQKETQFFPIYRTVVNGTVLQRRSIEPANLVKLNAAFTSQPITIEDSAADADIGGITVPLATRPALYTLGGELEDHQPTSILTLCTYRNRLFGITGDRQTILFSKSWAENPGVAPGFNPELRIIINDTLTGLAVLDERLIIFAESGIYYMAGEGPAPNGDGSDYGTPNRLQTDVGCRNPRGIVSGPDGVFFVSGDSSKAEIHMLDRKLNVQWIGKPVQDLLDAYPKVTSAVLVPKKNQARFSCQAEDGLTGIVLVYDYIEGNWSHFVYPSSLAIVDACIWNDAYTFLTTGGLVYQEDESAYLDDGVWITSKLETAWVHASGPLAYQSVRAFQIDGISAGNHGLSIWVGFNGNTTYQQGPRVWAQNVSGVTASGPIETARVSIGNRRKCRSIRFKIQDSEPPEIDTGQGPIWSSMGIEVGMKSGLGRLAERQKR